ncbi:hypothetical protein M422DRAFT_25476 [Sphaerobolus stellatus SS14]|nr:hypothetical protein M422DRAFT_25476 [Sphaerobolus stellatus SS14]
MLLSVVAGLIVALLPSYGVNGQASSPIKCTTDKWTLNSEGLTPCLVASSLQAPCGGGKWNIDPLPNNTIIYSGPKAGESNPCSCSTVVYSLVSACAACQGDGFITWEQWSTNCLQADTTEGTFPLTLPGGIAVPSWAYLSVNDTVTWDAARAQNFASTNPTESTAPATPTGATGQTNQGVHHSNKGGAIGGGVAGGVALVVLVGLGAFFFMRRRKVHRVAPSSQFIRQNRINEKMSPSPPPFFTDNPAYPMQMPRAYTHKLYDPSDPNTFPQSPAPSYINGHPTLSSWPATHGHSDSTSSGYESAAYLLSPAAVQSGRYTGLAEV